MGEDFVDFTLEDLGCSLLETQPSTPFIPPDPLDLVFGTLDLDSSNSVALGRHAAQVLVTNGWSLC